MLHCIHTWNNFFDDIIISYIHVFYFSRYIFYSKILLSCYLNIILYVKYLIFEATLSIGELSSKVKIYSPKMLPEPFILRITNKKANKQTNKQTSPLMYWQTITKNHSRSPRFTLHILTHKHTLNSSLLSISATSNIRILGAIVSIN